MENYLDWSPDDPKPEYNDAASLWKACRAYFVLAEDNPIKSKPRPFNVTALCLHLNINPSTWHKWRETGNEFAAIVQRVEMIIDCHKYENAVLGLFDNLIIARDLGLIERTEYIQSGHHNTVVVNGPDATYQ